MISALEALLDGLQEARMTRVRGQTVRMFPSWSRQRRMVGSVLLVTIFTQPASSSLSPALPSLTRPDLVAERVWKSVGRTTQSVTGPPTSSTSTTTLAWLARMVSRSPAMMAVWSRSSSS